MISFIHAELPLILSNVPEGMDAQLIAEAVNELAENQAILHIARDDMRMENLAELIGFFNPEVEIITFPAWDCLPYDRVSPNPDILARRMTSLIKILNPTKKQIIITTINAVTQRIPTRKTLKDTSFKVSVRESLDTDTLNNYLTHNGYSRASTVVDHGDYAIRGNIIDIFPSASENPLRIDLWGDEIDTIKIFDPISQRTEDKTDKIELVPMGEIFLDEKSGGIIGEN